MFRGPGSSVGTATGYGLDGPGIQSRWGARFSAPVQTGPGAHPASCTMGTGPFPGVKSGRGVTLTPHPLLVPWPWNSRAIPLLPLWAVRPVQDISAWTRVHFSLPTVFRKKNVGVELSLVCRYAVTHISSYEYDHQKAVASDDNAISTSADSFPLRTVILQCNV